jgi:hypothetical protein
MILSGLSVLLAIIPFVAKLEVGKDYLRPYLLGFPLLTLSSKDVVDIEYGSLFRGGLGQGKGLNIRFLKNGKSKTTSIGEKFWGKEAIQHAKRVLENK